jgi:hypothetical protein
MFKGIFDKKQAGPRGERHVRAASSAAPASTGVSQEAGTYPAVEIDETILALSRELSGLRETQVPQAAKERGWASLQRELERHPVHAAVPAARPVAGSRARRGSVRWAMGGAAAAVAVVATLLGTYSGGLLTANNDTPTTVVSVVSTDTSQPTTSSSIDNTTVTTNIVPTTDGTQPGTTQTSGTTVSPGTTGSSNPPTTGTSNPPTTQPTSPKTTGEKQREGSAKTAARTLADAVCTGNTSGARSIVSSEAQPSLAQMITLLKEPYGWTIDPVVQSLGGDVVRVTMAINDRVLNGQGELIEVLKHFAIKVRVDAAGAVIIAINAAS